MNPSTILHRLKQHPGIENDTLVGVASSFGKDAEIVSSDRTLDIVATLTTDDIDLEDQVLVANGANLDYFRKNGVVFADHRYEMTDYVGDLRAITPVYGADKVTVRGWKMRVHACAGLMGETVRQIVEHRGKIGISVGFIAEDYSSPTDEERKRYTQGAMIPRSIVRKFRVFEGSTTLLPCNVQCQAASSSTAKAIFKMGKAQDELLHDVDDLVRLGFISREAAVKLGMPIDAKRKFHAVTDRKSLRPVLKVFEWGSVG